MKTLVITGGHHTSALEVARQLKRDNWRVVWFGHRHSMWGDASDSSEYREVTAAGIKFYNLYAGKFYRTYNPLKLIRIPIGFIQSLLLLLLLRPDGIVSFGGYLAVPVVITGWLLGIPAITHEQIVSAGVANRAISFFVKKIAVTWPSSLSHYPPHKTVLVGLPLRSGIKPKKTKHSLPLVYITGGKQGSHLINKAIFDILPELLKKYKVIHQTGTSTLFNDLEKSQAITNDNYQSFGFDSQKGIQALQEADVVVGRAGAHTVYELGVLGKPCVLIPIPWVYHEQEKNAQVLEKAGLAIVIPESKLTGELLLTSIETAHKIKPYPLNLPLDGTRRLLQLIKQQFA